MATSNSPRPSRLPKGVLRRVTKSGPRYIATAHCVPFKPVSRTFEVAADAIAWRESTVAELSAQKRKGEARPDLATLTLAGLIREYLNDPVTLALSSVGNYESYLSWFVRHYGTVKVMEVSALVIREAREKLSPGVGPAHVNRHLAALRSCWNWGRNAGLVRGEHLWPTKILLTEPEGRKRYLSDEELPALLKAAAADGPTVHAMIILALATGMRQGELLRLTWADIDFDRARIRVLLTKNKDPRAVYLPPIAAETLKKLRKGTVVGTAGVFLNSDGHRYTKHLLRAPWDRIRLATGIKDFHWHDLRHSCASFLGQKGATLLEIGTVLGHKSPASTMRYVHLVPMALT